MESVPDRGGPERAIINLRRNGLKVGYEPFGFEPDPVIVIGSKTHVLRGESEDSFTCDECWTVHNKGYSDGSHAICPDCATKKYPEE
jgi:hypothetical protein